MRKQYAVFHYDKSGQHLVQSKRKASHVERDKAIEEGEPNPDECNAIFNTKEEAETFIEASLARYYPQFIIDAYRP